jgi:hypothetical protein
MTPSNLVNTNENPPFSTKKWANGQICLIIICDPKNRVVNGQIEALGANPLFIPLNQYLGVNPWNRDVVFEKDSSTNYEHTVFLKSQTESLSFSLQITIPRVDLGTPKSLPLDFLALSVEITAIKPEKIPFFRIDLTYPWDPPFDLLFVPHLRPAKDLIIGDHIFRSPALIMNKGEQSLAILPNLELISRNRICKQYLDMDHGDGRRLSYGLIDYVPYEHIFFKTKKGKPLNLHSGVYKFGFYLKLTASEPKHVSLRRIDQFMWNFHTKYVVEGLDPQVLPFEHLSNYGIAQWVDNYHGWREFEINGKPCGGLIYRSWMGVSRARYKIIKESELDKLVKRPPYDSWFIRLGMHKLMNHPKLVDIIGKSAETTKVTNFLQFWNQAWFLNVRSAYGIFGLGQLENEQKYCEMAEKILMLACNAPLDHGCFPSLCQMTDQGPKWIEGIRAFAPIREYNLVDMALTCYWIILFKKTYYAKMSEGLQKEICRFLNDSLPKVIEMMIVCQLESGAVPTFVGLDKSKKDSHSLTKNIYRPVKGLLYESPGSAAIGMLFCEYYKITHSKDALAAAIKIRRFLDQKIIPENQWYDYETFYSCTAYALRYKEDHLRDPYTLCLPQNNMSIYWAADFYRLLYTCTDNRDILQMGRYLLDYLLLYQQVWNPPFLSFWGLGGFGCQNTDAEWSDTRQGLFARELIEYFFETGHEEYLERGIMAMKASFVLMLHERHKEIAPGNFRWALPDDFGVILENYGHTGMDFPVPGVVTPDWGLCTAMLAYIWLFEKLGDLCISLYTNKAYGVNGCAVKGIKCEIPEIQLDLEILPEKRKFAIHILVPIDATAEFKQYKTLKIRNVKSNKEHQITIGHSQQYQWLDLRND